jgi:hypothetical protein
MVRRGLAAIAVLLFSTAAFGVGTVEPVGKWRTSFGPMTIGKAADGTFSLSFEEYPGKATGEIYAWGGGDGDMRMKGAWWDIIKDRECPDASEGSRHWGGFDVTFHGPPALDREVVGGVWTFCELIKPMPTDGSPQVTEGWSFSGEKVN